MQQAKTCTTPEIREGLPISVASVTAWCLGQEGTLQGSWKLRSSNPISKDQAASKSFSRSHSTDSSMGCLIVMKPSGLSYLGKALVELGSCLCWSWKAEMYPTLAIPNLAKPHSLSSVGGFS